MARIEKLTEAPANDKASGYQQLKGKIEARSSVTAIVGLGIVGLATAVGFADVGFPTKGYDINNSLVSDLKNGKPLYHEEGLSSELKRLVSRGSLAFTSEPKEALASSDIVIVCVPTPLKKSKAPDLRYLLSAIGKIGGLLRSGALVCITSTVPPLTTLKLIKPALERASHLTCGRDFWLSYCPERVIPGDALNEFRNNAKVIGGCDLRATELSEILFSQVTKGRLCLTDSTSAEVSKLAENSIRDVEIAFANQLALLSERIGVRVREVIACANTHPRVRILQPGPGVGGACLPKDPYMLMWPYGYSRTPNPVIVAARNTNESMPKYILRAIMKTVRRLGKPASKTTIAVLGTAYKGNTGDTRNSPAEPIIRELVKSFARVVSYDPYTPETFGAERGSDLSETIRTASCLVILADHREFGDVDFASFREKKIIFDFRNLLDPGKIESFGHVYVGLASGHTPIGYMA